MKPRSKVCFIGQLISQKKHFHLSFYNLGLDLFREDRDDLVEIIINYTKVKNNSFPNFKRYLKCYFVFESLKDLAFQYPVLELMLF